jgi:hypothetical protein
MRKEAADRHTAFVPALMVLHWRPAKNTLRASVLLFNGIIQYLFPALILLKAVVWIAGITPHIPFFQPSAGSLLTIATFGYLVVRAYLRFRRASATTRGRPASSLPDCDEQ